MIVSLVAAALVSAPVLAGAKTECHVGAYRLDDHTFVDIGPSGDEGLRWRRFDGTTGALTRTAMWGRWISTAGWTGRPDGKVVDFRNCAEIRFDGVDGRKIEFDVRETSIRRGRVKLAGRLVLPKGRARVPVIILVHGSESSSALHSWALQRILPAAGVGVFVYDKRGTGASTGNFTMSFDVLAGDAVSAMRAARKLAGKRAARFGYYGTSQGGWVAPLAATQAKVDFVIVGYGLAVSPIEEDQEEAALDMRLRGFGPAIVAKAQEVAAAAEQMLRSDLSSESVARFQSVRARYSDEPWFKYLQGNVTRFALTMPLDELKSKLLPMVSGIPWNYDPMPVLRKQTVPELWILGADDLEAPSAETSSRLRQLAAHGRPFTVAIFPHTEHGIYEFETDSDGKRLDTRNPEGMYRMIRDFATGGRLSGDYGAGISLPR